MTDEEKKAADLEAKNEGDDDTSKNEGEETDGGDGGDGAGADVDKKDYSKMSDEEIVADLKTKHKDASADELLAELAKQTKIIGHKNRAINSLKTKKTDEAKTDIKPEEKKTEVDDLDKPITKRELLELNNKRAVEALVNSETKDDAERKAIMQAYDSDIVKSGDIAKDFKKALAIASVDKIDEYRKNRSLAEKNESEMTNFSGGGNYGGGESTAANDAVKRSVAANLKMAGYDQKAIDAELAKL